MCVSFHDFCRWKEAVDFTSFDDLQNLFEFVVKFKNRDIKVSQSDIEVMSQWITPNDMTDALFEVKNRTHFALHARATADFCLCFRSCQIVPISSKNVGGKAIPRIAGPFSNYAKRTRGFAVLSMLCVKVKPLICKSSRALVYVILARATADFYFLQVCHQKSTSQRWFE